MSSSRSWNSADVTSVKLEVLASIDHWMVGGPFSNNRLTCMLVNASQIHYHLVPLGHSGLSASAHMLGSFDGPITLHGLAAF